ncbi:ISSfl4 transposase OrfC [Escherichia coli O145:H28]|nr:ISSfl4 transposase OrfC [Escherichia coli O145:H28]
MLPSETMIWQPEFTDKTLSRKPGAVQIEGGIAPEKVLLDHASGGFSSTTNGIKILIQEIVMKLPECNYRAQGYRFDYHDEMGCAINNTRSSSIINPYKLNY